jgi:hypothetical protein
MSALSPRASCLAKLAHHDGHFRLKIGDPKVRCPFGRCPLRVVMNGPDALEMRCPLLSRKQTPIGRRRKVGFLDLIPKSLRTNQAHRSAAIVPQRFDHPPPPAPEWTYSRVKIRSWRSNRDVCFADSNLSLGASARFRARRSRALPIWSPTAFPRLPKSSSIMPA